MEKPVIILGAGATKACDGPLTDEILPAALNGEMAHDNEKTMVKDREELLALTEQFLTECFNVPSSRPVTKEDCPSLPMVLSMLRRSEDMSVGIGRWQGRDLVKVRRAIEYAAFAVIEAALRQIPPDKRFHTQLLTPLYERDVEPTVISLNYDVIVDNAMFTLSEKKQGMRPPAYRVEIATERYRDFCARGTFGRLLKIHGSLNWLYCETCHRLDLFVSEGMRTGKALDELYHTVPFDDAYSCKGTPCRNKPQCKGFVSPILITPTYFKDYENPHIKSVWNEAEQAMKEATRAIFIGYSLPTDDVEVAMLFKRGLGHLPPKHITVVEYVRDEEKKQAGERTKLADHPTGQRFRTLFGKDLDWQTTGFAGWLREQKAANNFPFTDA
jgi:hypothetical protein